MENLEKIRNKIKDSPDLLETLKNLENLPRQRNEIYIYCFQRETQNSQIHYIPLITYWENERKIMACNNLLQLQNDYEREVILYKLYGYPIVIIEVPFDKYLELSMDLEKYLNENIDKNSFLENVKRLKTESLFSNIELDKESIPNNMLKALQLNNNYCKCFNEKLEIVNCTNYKPIIPLSHLNGNII